MPLSINIPLAQLIAAFIFGRLKMILLVLLLLASAVQGNMSNFNTLSFFLCCRLSQFFSWISESRTTLIRTLPFFCHENRLLDKKSSVFEPPGSSGWSLCRFR